MPQIRGPLRHAALLAAHIENTSRAGHPAAPQCARCRGRPVAARPPAAPTKARRITGSYSGTPHHQPCNPKAMNSRPPSRDTVRSLMCAAIWRPPITAAPVQIAWPRMPPSVTPYTSVDAARPIVAICAAQSGSHLSLCLAAVRKTSSNAHLLDTECQCQPEFLNIPMSSSTVFAKTFPNATGAHALQVPVTAIHTKAPSPTTAAPVPVLQATSIACTGLDRRV